MADLKPVPQPSFDWHGPDSGPPTKYSGDAGIFAPGDIGDLWREKIVGPNNLRPVSFLRRGIEVAGAVAHITVPGVGDGTGFLVTEDLLLTNNHVLDSEAAAAAAIIRFNYEFDLRGDPLEVDEVRCDPNRGFQTSPYMDGGVDGDHLDYTVVRLASTPGGRWGTIALTAVNIRVPSDVVVIQHPGGERKQIAIADNELVYADELKCQYLTDTLPGSSGSPVFDDRWNLIALHHAGGFYAQPGDPTAHLRNEGVRVSAILADLSDWARALVSQA